MNRRKFLSQFVALAAASALPGMAKAVSTYTMSIPVKGIVPPVATGSGTP